MRFKRKKSVRMRGGQTHGWGAKKKRRGAGHRGGRGRAGSGKRADSKKPSIWQDPHYFGKVGFTSLARKTQSINLQFLEEHTVALIQKGHMKQQGDFYTINLHDIGCDKLVSKGRVTRKYQITCTAASAQAIEKVKSAGGDVAVSK